MRPYRIVEESDTHVTYEYRTAYTWVLLGALVLLLIGVMIPNEPLELVASLAVFACLIARIGLGRAVNARIRQAMNTKSVQVSGNRISFSNPLRVRVPKC